MNYRMETRRKKKIIFNAMLLNKVYSNLDDLRLPNYVQTLPNPPIIPQSVSPSTHPFSFLYPHTNTT